MIIIPCEPAENNQADRPENGHQRQMITLDPLGKPMHIAVDELALIPGQQCLHLKFFIPAKSLIYHFLPPLAHLIAQTNRFSDRDHCECSLNKSTLQFVIPAPACAGVAGQIVSLSYQKTSLLPTV